MLECDYFVKQIDGDYAHLQRVDRPEEELKLVARALLPAEIYEGCILHYEMMQYSMKQESDRPEIVIMRRECIVMDDAGKGEQIKGDVLL